MTVGPEAFQVLRQIPGAGSVTLAGEQSGEGPPVVLLHGLSATRRNVVQGSSHLIRRGYRLIAYDARGHGESSPAPVPAAYEYGDLIADLKAVLRHFELDRAALVGSSMGAATAMAFAIEHPGRVPALVQITPAYAGQARTTAVDDRSWARMADALDRGLEEFVEEAQPEEIPERWREIAREATRQRMERHEYPGAVAAALRVVPHSLAWRGWEPVERLEVPTLVVASRDEADALHPLAVAQEYVRRLPHGELAVEEEGQSPLAWQGARLSKVIGDFLERAGYS
jgi:pimeloyl-ACP methyl ester carboxylesterase